MQKTREFPYPADASDILLWRSRMGYLKMYRYAAHISYGNVTRADFLRLFLTQPRLCEESMCVGCHFSKSFNEILLREHIALNMVVKMCLFFSRTSNNKDHQQNQVIY